MIRPYQLIALWLNMKTLHVILVFCVLLGCQVIAADAFSGFVIGWGLNGSGQATGVPSLTFSNGLFIPTTGSLSATGTVTVGDSTINDAVAIAAGMSHGLALRRNGTVVGWGDNGACQAIGWATSYPSMTNGLVEIGGHPLEDITAIAAGRSDSLALTKAGTLVPWGCAPGQTLSPVPADLTNVLAVSAGRGFISYGLALKKDGTVKAWGGAKDPPEQMNGIIAISADYDYGANLALKSNGTVIEWPVSGAEYVSNVPPGLTNAMAISAGYGQRLALLRDGTVIGWGSNGGGQATGIPTPQSPYISSGLVRIDGQIVNHVTAIAAGNGYSLALKANGTVVAWGRINNGLQPATVPAGLSNVVAIAAGDDFCLAITTNKAVAQRFHL